MRFNDYSEIKTVDGKLTFQDRLQGMLNYGFSWPQDVQAQETFLTQVRGEIDNRSTMMRNYLLPDVDVTIPFLLIGPPGIRVFVISRERGVFRAREGHWMTLSGNTFKPAKRNLILQAQLYAKAVQKFLGDLELPEIEVEGIIVGVDPGMHVDTQRPAVRVIQADAIRRFANQWNQEDPTTSSEDIYKISSTLTKLAEPEEEFEAEIPRSRRAPAAPQEDKFAQSLEPLQKTFNFSPTQWIVLGLLAGGTVLVLLIFMILIFLSL